MKSWFLSLNGAITLSVIALLAVLARLTFLDALFVPEFRNMFSKDQPGPIVLAMLGFMVFFGGWMWALLSFMRGSRAGMIVTLIYSLIVAFAFGVFTLIVFCPVGCAAWPAGNFIVWVALTAGLAASIALGFQLRIGRER